MAVIGGAGVPTLPQLTITQSQTWVPPQDGNICVHLVGAGGGGLGTYANGRGGGGGAYGKVPILAVTTAGSFTLVVSAGGAGGTNTSASNGIVSGGSGGVSSIAGTGLTGTKTAGGGVGASASANGAGGTISGSGESWAGYTGGLGNSGGGGVGIYGTGAAGTIMKSDASAGGLGMSGFGYICGGSHVQSGNNGEAAQNFVTIFTDRVFPSTAGDLCGGGSVVGNASNTIIMGGNGGIGGGGGFCTNAAAYSRAIGGRGGDGIILIQYLP